MGRTAGHRSVDALRLPPTLLAPDAAFAAELRAPWNARYVEEEP